MNLEDFRCCMLTKSNVINIARKIAFDNRQTLNTVLNIALEEYLKNKGYEIDLDFKKKATN